MRIRKIIFICIVSCLAVTLVFAQGRFNRRSPITRGRGNVSPRGRGIYSPRGRGNYTLRSDFPTWEIDPEFADDVFTFARIEYDSYGGMGWWDRWDNDYPDADYNFSYRLQQLTSLNVNPHPKLLRLTDPELSDYPFIYFSGVQRMTLSRPEQIALRRYLLNGGFAMMSDFWNPQGWANMLNQMRGVFPDREPVELTLDEEIFHIVFDLKELPQITDIQTWREGASFEYEHGYSSRGDEAPHFWSYYDDHGRMVALLCHNNDLG
ncbi:MAG: DUF4159 domain-containing protein, partial [Sedimentisphaerales bacterium]